MSGALGPGAIVRDGAASYREKFVESVDAGRGAGGPKGVIGSRPAGGTAEGEVRWTEIPPLGPAGRGGYTGIGEADELRQHSLAAEDGVGRARKARANGRSVSRVQVHGGKRVYGRWDQWTDKGGQGVHTYVYIYVICVGGRRG